VSEHHREGTVIWTAVSLSHTLIADVPLSAFSVWTLIDQPGALIAIGDRKVF